MNNLRHKPVKIAVIDNNVLAAIGMNDILEIIMPGTSIRTFQSMEELKEINEQDFVHYFVSANVYIENCSFFRQEKAHTIVLTHGEIISLPEQVRMLNVCQPAAGLMADIMKMRQPHHSKAEKESCPVLSGREAEVLSMIAKGLMNKEIADQLNISITTVISHRKNIMDKLHIRTVSGLTIYAALNGLVHIGELQNPH